MVFLIGLVWCDGERLVTHFATTAEPTLVRYTAALQPRTASSVSSEPGTISAAA